MASRARRWIDHLLSRSESARRRLKDSRRRGRVTHVERLEARELLTATRLDNEQLAEAVLAGGRSWNLDGSPLAYAPDAGYIATWAGLGGVGDDLDVLARRYTTDGIPQGGVFRLSTLVGGDQNHASVSLDSTGAFVAVWDSAESRGANRAIQGQRFSAAGVKLGREFVVSSSLDGDQYTPTITHLTSGDFVVAWRGPDLSGQEQIFGRLFSDDGIPMGDEFQVTHAVRERPGAPAIAATDDGGFFIRFRGDGSGSAELCEQRYSAQGDPIGVATQAGVALTIAEATATSTLGSIALVDSEAVILDRRVFYNDSCFDGYELAAESVDDAALCSSTTALVYGQQATSTANCTTYLNGINGVMIDIDELPTNAVLTTADFEFRFGNSVGVSSWTTTPAPAVIAVRRGAGVSGSDRVELMWTDGAIQNEWLQVTMLPTKNTGLAQADTFLFGNRIGDVTGDGQVTMDDVSGISAHNGQAMSSPNKYDIDGSGLVGFPDIVAAFQHCLAPTLVFPALPVASIAVQSTLYEGGDVALSAVLPTDSPTITNYEWDWYGDGYYDLFGPSEVSPTFAPTNVSAGESVTVGLRVTTVDGWQYATTTTITVENTTPTASVDWVGPDPAIEGNTIQVTGSAVAPAGDTISYAWQIFKDGSPTEYATGSGSSWSFVPTDDGSYEIRLTVTDEENSHSSDSYMLTVENALPMGAISLYGPFFAKVPVLLAGEGVAAYGSDDTLTYSWTVYDDQAALVATNTERQWWFTPPRSGGYDIELTIHDEDGGDTVVTIPRRYTDTPNKVWIGGNSGFWDDDANWSDDAAPCSYDLVLITTPGTITVPTGYAAQAEYLWTSANLVLESGSSLSVDDVPFAGGAYFGGSVTVNAATLNLYGNSAFASAITVTSGAVHVDAALTTIGGNMTLTGTGTCTVDGSLVGGSLTDNGGGVHGSGILQDLVLNHVAVDEGPTLAGECVSTGTLSVASGTLQINGRLTNVGTIYVDSDAECSVFWGATLVGGTLAGATGAVALGGGTLNGVTLSGVGVSGTMAIRNGLTVQGTLNLLPTTQLLFQGSQSIVGNGTISSQGGALKVEYGNTPTTLTLGTSIALTGNVAITTNSPENCLVNNGTLNAATGQTLSIDSALRNVGTLAVSDGTVMVSEDFTNVGNVSLSAGNLTVQGAVSNQGAMLIDAGTLAVGESWSNQGNLTVKSGGVLSQGNTSIIHGQTVALSGTELYFTWAGVQGGNSTIYEVQRWDNQVQGFVVVAEAAAGDSTYVLSQLQRNTSYRMRIVATTGTTKTIYEGADTSTQDVQDAYRWYKFDSIKDSTGTTLKSTARPNYDLDRTWVYAASPESAILQRLHGLVDDESLPVKNGSGRFSIWELHTTPASYSFSSPYLPAGAYSAVEHDINVGTPDEEEPCDKPCGCDSNGSGLGGSLLGGLSIGSGAATMAMNAIDSSGGCASCGTGSGGLTYYSREDVVDSGYGSGWSDADELPVMLFADQAVGIRFGAEQATWFEKQANGSYAARNGGKSTLIHDAGNHTLVYTKPDGTSCEFYDTNALNAAPGAFLRRRAIDGPTLEVTAWDYFGNEYRPTEVLYRAATTGQAYQKREFTYVTTTDGMVHTQTVALSQFDATTSTWTKIRKLTYTYYVTESFGLPGDLKTIRTQYWDTMAAKWSGNDTNYFRYYTDATHAHQLKTVTLANAYAALSDITGGHPENASESSGASVYIGNYTCFFYEYDANGRVTRQQVFGESNSSTTAPTLSTNAQGYNNWARQNVETRPDGSTNTIFTNYLGQTLLTDLYDPATQTHTMTYNRYDGTGRQVLTAEPSAVSGYNSSQADLGVSFTSDGLVHETVYYATTSGTIDEDTAGGVVGYVAYQVDRRSEGNPTPSFATTDAVAYLLEHPDPDAAVLDKSDYFARTVGSQTIYVIANRTTYPTASSSYAPSVTSYTYAWYDNSLQIKEQVTTLPAVSTQHNGSGANTTRMEWFDSKGNLTWSMDELQRVRYSQYDTLTGQLTRTIEDIDSTTATSLGLTVPDNWTLPGSGANLITDYQYDALGRSTQTLGPVHSALIGGSPTAIRSATWTVYLDATHEIRSAQGYAQFNSSSGQWDLLTVDGPISITSTDLDGRLTGSVQATYSGGVAGLETATFSQSQYTAWTAYKYSKTHLVATAVYDDIPTETTDSDGDGFVGTKGVHYDVSTQGYENNNQAAGMGRQVISTDIAGTIQHTFLDARGNGLQTWMGTDDVPDAEYDSLNTAAPNCYDFRRWVADHPTATTGPAGTNMVLISSATYDAQGNVVLSRSLFDAGANDVYATENRYDWRNRRTDTRSPANVVTHNDYDNLSRTVATKTYASADFTFTSGELRGQAESLYDALGRVYESRVYEIDPTTHATADYLPSRTWYDARGAVLKTATANGLFQKNAYDGVGRLVASYTSFDLDETAYDEADDAVGDTVIEQSQTWSNPAGQQVATATYQRLPGDSTSTGPLTAANSYATAAVTWYDGLDRALATADFGREDTQANHSAYYFFNGSTGALIDANANGIPDQAESTRPPTRAESGASLAGTDFQLQITQYDAAGRAYRTLDNLGRVNETQFDEAGRTIRTVQNYSNGTVEETDTECDLTVDYEYDARGRMVGMTTYNAQGSGQGVQTQSTRYAYGSAVNAQWQTNVAYPDSADIHTVVSLTQGGGLATATVTAHGFTTGQWIDMFGATESQYNGHVQITVTGADTYTYSVPTSAPTTASGSIRAYNSLGTDQTKTEHDRLGRTTNTTDQRGVVHQFTFDLAGRLTADTATSLGSSGVVDGRVRRIGTTYDDLGRAYQVTSYSDTGGNTAVNQVQYEYNGWGQLAREYQNHDMLVATTAAPSVQYAYTDGASGGVATYVRLTAVTYPNGRTVQYGYGTTGVIDDIMSRLGTIGDGTITNAAYKYLGAGQIVEEDYAQSQTKLTYLDATGNVTGLDRFGRVVDQMWNDYDSTPGVADEYTYVYNAAGDRTSRTNALNAALSETYTYDGLDRLTEWWRNGSQQKTWTLDALGNDRNAGTYNAANEMTPNQGSSAYDAAGNMVTLQSGRTTTYDAWNRLMTVNIAPTWIASHFEYDGTNRRIQIFTSFIGTTPGKVQSDYYQGQQVIETNSFIIVNRIPFGGYQMVWSPRYIDAPILRDTLTPDHTGIMTTERIYYMADANYNVTGLVKYDSGAGEWKVVERYSYSPYGVVTRRKGDWSTPTDLAIDNRTLYAGRTLDPLTALYYYRARYYDAALERFVSQDPIGMVGGINLYQYVGDAPVSATDPYGLWKRIGQGTIYEAEYDGDDISKLAFQMTGNGDDWSCIWPVKGADQKRYWSDYPLAKECARADVRNLMGHNAIDLKLAPNTTSRDHYLHAVRLLLSQDNRGGSVHLWTTGPGAGQIISLASHQGDTPIRWLAIGGHSNGTAVVGNRAGEMLFQPGDIPSQANNNTYENAVQHHGPSRCWFTRNAQVWGLGCNTNAFAADFASRILRHTATAYGTNTLVEGRWEGKNARVSFDGGPGPFDTLAAVLGATGPWVAHKGQV